MAALNNVTTEDDYSDATTLRAENAVRVNLDISNAAIYYQLSRPVSGLRAGADTWGSEIFAAPTFQSLDRRTNAIRVRSAVSAEPAQVTIDALTAEEIG